jgi:flavin reductase (DIM6/NTAB) family NADH-FMN oxidoreductase RutF
MNMPDVQQLMSRLWTPLVAVTAAAGGRRSGQIALTAHGASIVPQRPRLTIALWKTNLTRDLVDESGAFAVHVLRSDQDELVYHLGMQSGYAMDKLASVPHEMGETGSPVLRDCLGVFECRVLNRMDGGDHTVFLGEVVRSAAVSDGEPLWWQDLRARMPEERREQYARQITNDITRALGIMDQIHQS